MRFTPFTTTTSNRRLLRRAAVVLVACGAAASASASAGQASSNSYFRLVQYPRAGFGGLYAQIAHARRTIDMEMYELEDRAAERDLASAAARGVTVRVLLDRDFGGAEVNRSAAQHLAAHRVRVRWAPPGYIFHIKTTTFDAKVADISTANLVAADYRTTRDAEIVDSDPAQVHAIDETFLQRLVGRSVRQPAGSDRAGGGADLVTGDGLEHGRARARHRDPIGAHDDRLRIRRALYIHEKLILDDRGTARESLLVGSQNASVTSLTRNRELGILLGRAHGGAAAITSASATFDWDFDHASPWSLPKPTRQPQPKPTPTSCSPKTSSGNCYEPGEYCSDADHGTSGVAGHGEPIICENKDGWRWEPK